MASIDQQFVEYVVRSLVEHPDDVEVDRTVDEKGVLLMLRVNPDDLGRVIGRNGVTAHSLRTLLRALGTKNSARYNLKIVNTDDDRAAQGESTATSESTSDDSVEKSTDETVENDDRLTTDYAKKSRQELAELDDLDI